MESRSSDRLFYVPFLKYPAQCKIVSAEMIEIPARCPPQSFFDINLRGISQKAARLADVSQRGRNISGSLRAVDRGDFCNFPVKHREIIAQTGEQLCQGGPFAECDIIYGVDRLPVRSQQRADIRLNHIVDIGESA